MYKPYLFETTITADSFSLTRINDGFDLVDMLVALHCKTCRITLPVDFYRVAVKEYIEGKFAFDDAPAAYHTISAVGFCSLECSEMYILQTI